MFKYDDRGLGPGKWLYWFIGLMSGYAVLTAFPDNKIAALIGAILAAAGIALAHRQLAKWWKDRH